jgi:hypothetical protein
MNHPICEGGIKGGFIILDKDPSANLHTCFSSISYMAAAAALKMSKKLSTSFTIAAVVRYMIMSPPEKCIIK